MNSTLGTRGDLHLKSVYSVIRRFEIFNKEKVSPFFRRRKEVSFVSVSLKKH